MTATDAGCGEHEPAVASEQIAARGSFQLFPDLIGAQHQRHKFAAFADGLAGDAGLAVRRALIVRRREAVDADGLCSELRGLVERSAAHRSQPDDHNVCDDCHVRHNATRPKSRRKRAAHERLFCGNEP